MAFWIRMMTCQVSAVENWELQGLPEWHVSGSLVRLQSQVLFHVFEVPIVVNDLMTILQAKCAYYNVDGLAYSDTC